MNSTEPTLQYNGRKLSSPAERAQLLRYWIEEREQIRTKKEGGSDRPWSTDEVFQVTYFCNAKREYDKVTRWIRDYYSPSVGHPDFELNIALARWLNWPATLEKVGFLDVRTRTFGDIEQKLNFMPGKVFGNAYVVSTNGQAMAKSHYLCTVLLPAAYGCFGASHSWRWAHGNDTLAKAYASLVRVHGLGSFMAGQLLADLKNTVNHPLTQADDWWDFVVPGPGSIRGVNWIMNGNPDRRGFSKFEEAIEQIRGYLSDCELAQELCNQDLQNCLCEFDKYCRVLTNTGKSKRSYNGF